MGTNGGVNPKAGEYPHKIPTETCTICGGEIPLTKDGKLRLHRQRNHHHYGIGGKLVPYCPASRSMLHSGVDRSC